MGPRLGSFLYILPKAANVYFILAALLPRVKQFLPRLELGGTLCEPREPAGSPQSFSTDASRD